MWHEVNTVSNLPAQLDVFATAAAKYEFLFVAKGGGSANKLFLFQETKALLNPKSFEKFVADKLPLLGTAACPPYHLVFVVGGTSAEACMKTLKLASAKYSTRCPPPETSTAGRSAISRWRRRCPDRALDRHRRSLAKVLPSTCASCACPVTGELPRRDGVSQRRPQHQGEDHEGRVLEKWIRPGRLFPPLRTRRASSASISTGR